MGQNLSRPKAVIMDENAMRRAVARISYEILEHNKGAGNLAVVGILSRGAQLARRIAGKIQEQEGVPILLGELDITSYRDDGKGLSGNDQTRIGFDLSGKHVILVDDVLYTGRTTRAAIEAVMARGRPATIQLAVLVDRGHRELPVRPDYVGKNVPTSKEEAVRVLMAETDGRDQVVIRERGEAGGAEEKAPGA